MPSRWIVTGPDGRIVVQFEQKIGGKLANPLHRCVLMALDADDRELWRVLDPRSSVPDRLLGTGPNDWAIVRGDDIVARFARLPREKQPSHGWRGALRKFLAGSDPGIVGLGPEHLLAGPAALGLLVLIEVLTDPP